MTKSKTSLASLKKGQKARVASLPSNGLCQRLMEMGLIIGATVELLHEAPFSKDPIALRVRGGVIALRRRDAQEIGVEPMA